MKVWPNAWLVDDANRFIETLVIEGLKSLHVRDLILNIGFDWDL